MEKNVEELKNPEMFYFYSKERYFPIEVPVGEQKCIIGNIKIPRLTVCGYLEGRILSFGISLCQGNDNFSRKLGRKISTGRAINKPYKVIKLEEKKCYNTFINNCKEIEQDIISAKMGEYLGVEFQKAMKEYIGNEIIEMNDKHK